MLADMAHNAGSNYPLPTLAQNKKTSPTISMWFDHVPKVVGDHRSPFTHDFIQEMEALLEYDVEEIPATD